MFHVGQKVVCVDAKPRHFPCNLVEGAIYTITEIVFYTPPEGVMVAEATPYTYAGYYADRFRPLTERKTDTGMAILKKLLQPKHERV